MRNIGMANDIARGPVLTLTHNMAAQARYKAGINYWNSLFGPFSGLAREPNTLLGPTAHPGWYWRMLHMRKLREE